MGILNILIIKYDKNHTNAFERKDLVTQETRKTTTESPASQSAYAVPRDVLYTQNNIFQ